MGSDTSLEGLNEDDVPYGYQWPWSKPVRDYSPGCSDMRLDLTAVKYVNEAYNKYILFCLMNVKPTIIKLRFNNCLMEKLPPALSSSLRHRTEVKSKRHVGLSETWPSQAGTSRRKILPLSDRRCQRKKGLWLLLNLLPLSSTAIGRNKTHPLSLVLFWSPNKGLFCLCLRWHANSVTWIMVLKCCQPIMSWLKKNGSVMVFWLWIMNSRHTLRKQCPFVEVSCGNHMTKQWTHCCGRNLKLVGC